MEKITAAELNTRVKFEENSPVQTTTGQWRDDYREFLETWGRVRKITGDRSFSGFQAQLIGKWEISVRYRNALENKVWKSMRIITLNRFFTVESINRIPENAPEFIQFIVKDQSDK